MIADGNGFGKTKQCLLTASLLFASTKENRPASLTLNHPEASQVQQENAEDETTDKHRTVNITEELHSSFYNATTASSSPLDPVLPDQPYSGEELQDNVASQEDLNQSSSNPHLLSPIMTQSYHSESEIPAPVVAHIEQPFSHGLPHLNPSDMTLPQTEKAFNIKPADSYQS
ncbi:hypothetical protein N7505_002540 [Penicillium chrysogenum]|uniref:Uncharacterized protein n=1 Tax=Penicillium chrysogenum TaxID=5076 RepID=A0ABQ8X002_PENCH|nr:hypothetical protein N7505_002540 [Penicillium chrysogenum]